MILIDRLLQKRWGGGFFTLQMYTFLPLENGILEIPWFTNICLGHTYGAAAEGSKKHRQVMDCLSSWVGVVRLPARNEMYDFCVCLQHTALGSAVSELCPC